MPAGGVFLSNSVYNQTKGYIMTICESAKKALSVLLKEAEDRDYDPPLNGVVLAELEWIIANSDKAEKEPYPVLPENDSFY